MKFTIEKPKTRKGLSYVLKSSLLQNAIEETGLDCNIHLEFWTPQNIDSVLSADYWLPNKNVEYDRFYIRAGVVNSVDRKTAQELMKTKIIPELVNRIRLIKSQNENSAKLKSGWFFEAAYKNGKLTINGKEIE